MWMIRLPVEGKRELKKLFFSKGLLTMRDFCKQ